ncbi:acyl-CoA thioesterase [Streptomyces pratensis]|uniref:acyl-CoA thioesterase n=1 Tax=Streptomyces pratensis TaxID=1169025 RepID=UPI00362595E3
MTYFVEVEVRGYELDTQGHLDQAVYLQYAEHARWELLREAGVAHEKLPADGIGPVQPEVTVKYLGELRGGDRVRASCELLYGTGKTFEIRRQVVKDHGTVAAEIAGVGGLIDLTARRLVTDPAGRFASLATKPELLGIRTV